MDRRCFFLRPNHRCALLIDISRPSFPCRHKHAFTGIGQGLIRRNHEPFSIRAHQAPLICTVLDRSQDTVLIIGIVFLFDLRRNRLHPWRRQMPGHRRKDNIPQRRRAADTPARMRRRLTRRRMRLRLRHCRRMYLTMRLLCKRSRLSGLYRQNG